MSRYINAPNFRRNAAIAATIVGITAFITGRDSPPSQIPTEGPKSPATEPGAPIPTPTELPQLNNAQIVEQAIRDLAIPPSADEIERWKNRRSIWEDMQPTSPDLARTIADLRIQAVFSGMHDSENEHFRKAITVAPLIRVEAIIINGKHHVTSVTPQQEGGPETWRLDTPVSRHAVLQPTVSKETLVILLVEQAEDIRNLRELMKRFPTLPPQRQFEEATKLASTPEMKVQIAARRVAAGIEAYLVQYALMGQSSVDTDPAYLKHVVAYLKHGENPEDQQWRAYVQNNILPVDQNTF